MIDHILITGMGAGAGQGILRALRMTDGSLSVDEPYYIVGIDPDPEAAGFPECDKCFWITHADQPSYIQQLINYCLTEKIQVLFIGCDNELDVIAKYKQKIEEKTGTIVICGEPERAAIFRNKEQTVRFLLNNNLDHPQIYLPSNPSTRYPVIVKPIYGSGSEGLTILYGSSYLEDYKKNTHPANWANLTLQELLDGPEFTSTVIIGKEGQILDSIVLQRKPKYGPRNAYVTRWVVDRPDLQTYAEDVALTTKLVGPINIQLRDVPNRGPVIFEVNPRFPGSTPLCAMAGMNGPHICIRHFLHGETPKRTKKQIGLAAAYRLQEVYFHVPDNH